MMITDSLLADFGWLFFAAWSVAVGAVSIAAFGPDLFPQKAVAEPPRKTATPVRIPGAR